MQINSHTHPGLLYQHLTGREQPEILEKMVKQILGQRTYYVRVRESAAKVPRTDGFVLVGDRAKLEELPLSQDGNSAT